MAEEIKSFKVHPDYESETINYRQKFGWEFVSTQEIYNKDTHLESGLFSDSVTSVTETVHYVKLTFKRDRSKVNPRLIQIEEELSKMSEPVYPSRGCDWVAGIIAMVTFTTGAMITNAINSDIPICLTCIIIFIVTVIRSKKRKEELEMEYMSDKQAYDTKLDALLRELDSLT